MSRKSSFRPAAKRGQIVSRAQTARPQRSLYRRPLRFEPLEDRRVLSAVTVTTLEDKVDLNDGLTSLREAIFATNTVPGADEITFAPSLTASGPATILLTQGELRITDALTITGPGRDLLTIDASGNDPTPDQTGHDGSRVFNIDDEIVATFFETSISGLTLTGGDVLEQGSAIRSLENLHLDSLLVTGNEVIATFQRGGAIYSSRGHLTVHASRISDNLGGAIAVDTGRLDVTDCEIKANPLQIIFGIPDYGGIVIFRGVAEITNSIISDHQQMHGISLVEGDLTVNRSTISGNFGGISANGNVSIFDSTISDNFYRALVPRRQSYGSGGIYARNGNLHLENCTISGNVVNGGLLFNAAGVHFQNGALKMIDCTVSSNRAYDNSIAVAISANNATTEITNCIISGNEVRPFSPSGPASAHAVFLSGNANIRDTRIVDNQLGVPNIGDDTSFGIAMGGTNLVLAGCTISSNDRAGGARVAGSNISVRDNVFADNTFGGLNVFASMGVASVEECLFVNNALFVTATNGAIATVVDCTVTGSGRVFATGQGTGTIKFTRLTVSGDSTSQGSGVSVNGKVSIADSLIEGRRGHDNGPSVPLGGGGIYVSGSGDLLLENTIIRNNSTEALGGGILVDRNGWATIRNCSIIGNTAISGGGVWSSGKVSMIGCNIAENSAARDGGGLFLSSLVQLQTVSIEDCTITGNTATRNGGGIFMPARAPNRFVISRSIIADNHAENRGGGIYSNGSTLTDVTIANNTAEIGGGIWSSGNMALSSSTIANNAADIGGGIWCANVANDIVNCTISGNSAVVGGGMYGLASIDHSTIAFNTATSSGGGISGNGNEVILHNSIVARNTAPLGRDLTGVLGTTFNLAYSLIGASNHSSLVPTAPGVPDGNGNFIGGTTSATFIDPLLAPLADNGGQLMPDGTHRLTHALLLGSPAINAGDQAAVAGENGVPIHDGRGAPFTRIYGGRIDIGAFELQPADVLAGDYNQNGIVDTADFNVWRNTTGTSVPPGTGADGNGDGHIDRLDYDLWKNNFGATTDNLGPATPATVALSLAAEAESTLATPTVSNPTQSLTLAESPTLSPAAAAEILSPTIVVTTLADTIDLNDGLTSLREAIFAANTVPGADEITFAPSLTASGPATILLTQGELRITDALTIAGPGANLLTIDASGNDPTPDQNNGDGSRIFNIDDGNAALFIDVAISGLTITGGDIGTNGSAVRNLENITIANAAIIGNSSILGPTTASFNASAVFNSGGLLELQSVTLASNLGLAIFQQTGRLSARETIITNNFGGIRATGDVNIVSSLVIANIYNSSAKIGGTLIVAGQLTIEDTTIRDNIGSISSGRLVMLRCTVTGNLAMAGVTSVLSATGVFASISDCEINSNGDITTTAVVRIGAVEAIVTGTRIVNNFGQRAFSIDGTSKVVTTTVTNCLIVDNTGIGAHIFGGAQAVLLNSIIDRNGAGIYFSGRSMSFDGCSISDNRMTGIYIDALSNSPIEIVRCQIIGNTFSGTGYPGSIGNPRASGVHVRFGKVEIRDSLIAANLRSSGVYIDFNGAVTFENCVISNHAAGDRGGGILSQGVATIRNSSITNNTAVREGGGIWASFGRLTIANSRITNNSALSGGGIYGDRITVEDSTISENSAVDNGGGVRSFSSTVTFIRTDIVNNHAGQNGGGIFSLNFAMTDSTVANNSADTDGGGIYSFYQTNGNAQIFNSSIANNHAGDEGGGIYLLNGALVQSTISGNTATYGAGMFVFPASYSAERFKVAIKHSTIASNVAAMAGGGLFVAAPTLDIRNTIIAKNNAIVGRDITGLLGTVITASYSLIGDNNASGFLSTPPNVPDANGNLIGGTPYSRIDPLLGPLAYNGGTRLTHLLLTNSPAIDAGDPLAVPDVGGVPALDQRGAPFSRIVGGRIDIGAVESQNLGEQRHWIVDTLVDEVDGDYSKGDLSLREAIGLSNMNDGYADKIAFAPELAARTIRLTLGELVVSDSVTIDGFAANSVVIDATASDPTPNENNGDGCRVFAIYDFQQQPIHVLLSNLLLTGGDVTGNGGAIYSNGDLTLSRMRIEENRASQSGGGVYVDGANITISASSFAYNSAFRDGGGLNTTSQGSISDSSFTFNSALNGGALFTLNGVLTIERALIANNSARDGGGVSGRSTTIRDSQVFGNSASRSGGGLLLRGGDIVNSVISQNSGGGVAGRANVDHTTIAFNVGGGVYAEYGMSSFRNTIIANNTGNYAPDLSVDRIAGSSVQIAYSLIGNSANSGLKATTPGVPDANGNLIGGSTNATIIDPKLAPLAYNGGQLMPDGTHRLTHALLPGSPAINAGDPAAVAGQGTVPIHDGRGAPFTRVYSGRIDIGAFELQPTNFVPGDYNQNGIVDTGDYAVWRNTMGVDVQPGTGADGNGDGHVDRLDYDLWKNNFGSTMANLPPAAPPANFLPSNVPPPPPAAPPAFNSAVAANARQSKSPIADIAFPAAQPVTLRASKPKPSTSPISQSSAHVEQALLAWLAARSPAASRWGPDADLDRPIPDRSTDDAAADTGRYALDLAFATLM